MPLRSCPSPQHGVQPGVTAHRSAPQVYTAPFALLRSWAVPRNQERGAASLRAVRPWLGWAAPRDEARSAIHSATVGNLAPTFQRFSTPDLTNREVLALTPSSRALIQVGHSSLFASVCPDFRVKSLLTAVPRIPSSLLCRKLVFNKCC